MASKVLGILVTILFLCGDSFPKVVLDMFERLFKINVSAQLSCCLPLTTSIHSLKSIQSAACISFRKALQMLISSFFALIKNRSSGNL